MTHESVSGSDDVQDDAQIADSSAINDVADVEEDEQLARASQPSLLETIVGFFIKTPAQHERDCSRRLHELNERIAYTPNTPTLYVLRGELFLERNEYRQAASDFRTALDIADAFDPTTGWGLVAQVMQDRAIAGLQRLNHNLS